jgi:hypothetical protein
MKNITIILTILIGVQVNAQQKWFSTYTDPIALVSDANIIIDQMTGKVEKANAEIKMPKNIAVKNTTPYLIFINIDSSTVNLPLWEEVIPQQKEFFADIAGGEDEGKKVFGLFFNGFYLAHELGHSIFANAGKKFDNAFDSEHDANTIGILYWRQTDENNQLKKCYDYAKKMLETLKNPVPENEDPKTFFTQHYKELASDPYKYGYIQFSQFVEIYEDKSLPDFNTFIKNYTK